MHQTKSICMSMKYKHVVFPDLPLTTACAYELCRDMGSSCDTAVEDLSSFLMEDLLDGNGGGR